VAGLGCERGDRISLRLPLDETKNYAQRAGILGSAGQKTPGIASADVAWVIKATGGFHVGSSRTAKIPYGKSVENL
jgi:hypothetical protein